MKSRFALIYIVAVLFFIWGVLFARYECFPWNLAGDYLVQIEDFAKGDPFDDTPFLKRLQGVFSQSTVQFEGGKYNVIGAEQSLAPDFFYAGQKNLPILLTAKEDGAYLVYGVFHDASDDISPYALLIGVDGRTVKRSWKIPFLEQSKHVRRMLITAEGDLITNNSDALRCYSWCGDLKWEIPPSGFHHEMDEYEGKVYLWRGDAVAAVDLHDQSVKTVLKMSDLILNNPDVSLLRVPLNDAFRYSEDYRENTAYDEKDPDLKNKTKAYRCDDPYHQNSVMVNKGVCSRYPKDALLLSFRHLDAVMVVEPRTAKILWMERFDRQHSPRWHADGISVFNNRTHFDATKIEYVGFDGARETIVDGEKYNIHRRITGNHRFLKDGSMMFLGNPPEFFHLDEQGRKITHFINLYDDRSLIVTNAYYIEQADLDRYESHCKGE
ncbi:arylsulfotransferase family protein [Desulfatibacillum aliphaticivorans]|uniref:arylsulfotransferase family protein n=1 Tax=Desulfatibacillum aliphaticivorans TaxID=218208 RepID=UPI0004135284|nr:arylsulfotransferase family protein [Desulfatibacillum aliphaticivorans]